jgi:wyosine [tRNA(Phe)-imidazoG37] synthetase (radical SAM superfamily)
VFPLERFNGDPESPERIATFLGRLRPARSYLAVPTRPPALAIVRPPSEEVIVRAHEILSGGRERVELH